MTDKPLVIFEIANNHMGDVAHLKKIIENYYEIKKIFNKKINFAIKFQYRNLKTFIHDNYKNSDHPQVKRFESTNLSINEWKKILRFSRKKFKLICTPFDEESINRVLKEKFDFLKIASCSANDWPFLEYLSKKIKKKKVICSLGGLEEDQISEVVSFFRNRNINVKFLYCVAKYPSVIKDLNLVFFKKIKDIHGDLIFGFSSHEKPDEDLSGALAYMMGARIFEKHIGLGTKSYKLNQYSNEPQQITSWLRNIEKAITAYGSDIKRSEGLKDENNQLVNFKRGVFLNKNKTIGESLNFEDVVFKFPNIKGQLLANDFSKFKNFKIKSKIFINKPVLKKDIIQIDNKNILKKIRYEVKKLALLSKVIIPKNSRIEISHHYGKENFYKFGLSMITVFNDKYCKKLLFLLKTQKHPEQYHKVKKETFFILFGKVELLLKIYKNNKLNKKNKIILNQGDLYTINPNVIHSFRSIAKTGSVIEELSTQSNKQDSYYVDKSITANKNRKSYISLY
jgi:sialic acid synthase SpsE/mannose-6-phosphate isomerase-like protein (cupin superfamily)